MTVTKEELRAMKPNKHVALDKAGVDAWGIYIASVSKWHETRAFVVGNMVCKYSRAFGNSRTTWKSTTWPNTEAALEFAAKVASSDSVLFGSPILVQLTDSDVALVKAGKMPNARYRGQARHEQLYGKVSGVESFENAKLSHGGYADFAKVVAVRPSDVSATPGLTHATAVAASGPSFHATPGPVDDEPF